MASESNLDFRDCLSISDFGELDDFIKNCENDILFTKDIMLSEEDILSQFDDNFKDEEMLSSLKTKVSESTAENSVDETGITSDNFMLINPLQQSNKDYIVPMSPSPASTLFNGSEKTSRTHSPSSNVLQPQMDIVYTKSDDNVSQLQQTDFHQSNFPYKHIPGIIRKKTSQPKEKLVNEYIKIQTVDQIRPNSALSHPVLLSDVFPVNSQPTAMSAWIDKVPVSVLSTGLPVVLESDKLPIPSLKQKIKNTVPKAKEVKRSMHNVVEKRYRTSINDRIIELKHIIAGPEVNMNKSLILRKTIDYIKYLQDANMKLKQENIILNRKLDKYTIVTCKEKDIGGITAPEFESSSHSISTTSDDISLDQEKMEEETELDKVSGVFGHTRITLCMLIFSIIVFNPLKFILYPLTFDNSEVIEKGRSLLEMSSVENRVWNFKSSFILYIFNIFIVFYCFLKLLFYDVNNFNQSSLMNYWHHRKQADVYLLKGNTIGAKKELNHCLLILGAPLPSSGYGLTFSCLFEVLRQFFYRLWIGKLFSRKVKIISKSIKVVNIFFKEKALVYHYLHRLNLIEKGDFTTGLFMALSSINYSEASEDDFSKEELFEIYIAMAFQLKESCLKFAKLMSRYYFRLGQQMKNSDREDPLWIFSLNTEWSFSSERSIFTELTDNTSPLAYTSMAFRDKLIECLLQSLVAPGSQIYITGSVSSGSPSACWLMLRDNLYFKNRLDVHAKWWSNVLGVATYWINGDESKAEELYLEIEAIPPYLLNSSIVKSTLFATKMRYFFLSIKNSRQTLKYAALAYHHLLKSRTSDPVDDVKCLYVQLMVCGWLLETRTALWKNENISISSSFLINFQNDLDLFRRITHRLSYGSVRMFIFETVGRLIACASPIRTLLILDRILKSSIIHDLQDKSQDMLSSEEEHTAAVYFSCKHLLSSIRERVGLLLEAAKSLEKMDNMNFYFVSLKNKTICR